MVATLFGETFMLARSQFIEPAPTRDLVWLRRLFTVFALLGTYAVVRNWRNPAAWPAGPRFDLLSSLVLLPLVGGACVAAWRGRWRAFVLLAVVDRAISAFGALLYFLQMALPSETIHPLKHPEYLAWNFLSVTVSTAILFHLARKYPPDVQEISGRTPVPLAFRFLQGSLGLLALAITIDIAPELRRHWTEEGLHLHSCAWFLVQSLVAGLLGCAFVAALRNHGRAFVSLGFIGLTLVAFYNFTHLTSDSFRDELYGSAHDPIDLARNLPVFAFALFTVVYLALRFPPDVRLAKAYPTTTA